ncbi:MAG: short-chain fatty acyl-CoA regulator family protein [Pseudomonadota bacterium]|nr:short-chain fatty acyl-CoA regulator family protein [Pseudomonadota bacterium]
MPAAMTGLRIRERRRAAGLRQVELAERMGISASYLNLIEREKRRASPELVARAARALGADPAELDGAVERRLADRMVEIAADPEYADLALDVDAARDLLGRHPDWGRALARAWAARREAARTVEALSDRLTHDPFLSDAVHRMLTHVAAMRSTSEILEGVEDIEPAQRRRFHEILLTESTRASEVSENLARFFDVAHQGAEASTPVEDVEEAFLAAGNRFPTLEPPEPEGGASAHPEAIYGALRNSLPGGGAAVAPPEAPPVIRRRALGEAVARRRLAGAIEAEIEARPRLRDGAARRRAETALVEYAVDAMLMPAAPFAETGRRLGWDLDAMAASFGVGFDAAARRLTTLGAQGGGAPRAAYVRINAAGMALQRRLLPEITLPRHGAACPLWALYRALSQPGQTLRQLAEFPSGERAVFVARAEPPEAPAWGRPPQHEASVAAFPGEAAAATVYAPRPREAPEPVGPNCRVCARDDCRWRADDPVIG